eukprot:9286647-Lingulodinium_polyedra.AAC.1
MGHTGCRTTTLLPRGATRKPTGNAGWRRWISFGGPKTQSRPTPPQRRRAKNATAGVRAVD